MVSDVAPALIALDWGTTSLRGWLLGADGTILERRAGGPGVMSVPAGGFAAAYDSFTADWRRDHPVAPAIASGMVGSRQGWIEAPYVDCPAGFDAVVAGLTRAAADAPMIVPGVARREAGAMPDVMRGEETQIFGALGDDSGGGAFVLPGTHSKWAVVERGRIVRFSTWMTGELFAVLRAHSILGRTMPADGAVPHDGAAFAAGVRDGLAHGASLPSRLFGVRAGVLLGRLEERGSASFLSGLLIGAEIGAAVRDAPAGDVVLIGAAGLVARYAEALTIAGIASRTADPDVTPRGLWRTARAAGLVA
ncbi:MAG: 2-dehydro-3-deoxygalactonokinase [Rhodospirillales bacterium]|nr:MAG: 2-dehydro-3-deoxygalactonokinase [Rhodospirillales bacterium]